MECGGEIDRAGQSFSINQALFCRPQVDVMHRSIDRANFLVTTPRGMLAGQSSDPGKRSEGSPEHSTLPRESAERKFRQSLHGAGASNTHPNSELSMRSPKRTTLTQPASACLSASGTSKHRSIDQWSAESRPKLVDRGSLRLSQMPSDRVARSRRCPVYQPSNHGFIGTLNRHHRRDNR